MRDARLKGWVVVLAMVPYVLLGYPWFSVFRDPWFHGGGLTVEQLRSGPGYATAFSLAIAAGVLTARVLAFLIARLGWTSALGGLRAGGLAWLGFLGPVYATQYTFEARSLAYFGITAGFPLVGFLGMGAILGRWGFRKADPGGGAADGALVAVLAIPLLLGAVPGFANGATLHLEDGVEMAYVDRGSGEPALVFVHCGNCRKEIWTETLETFETEHRVVAMDMAGYGGTAAGTRENFTIGSYGADVAALVDYLGLRRVVLIGNSLGGPVALEAAQRLGPDRVLEVIAVDTLNDAEQTWPQDRWQEILARYRRDFEGTCRETMLGLLAPGASSAVRSRIERETCHHVEARAAIALLETIRGYDIGRAMRDAAVPIWAINSTFYPTAVETNRRYAVSFDLVPMEGVGHYPQVEHPAEFQRHLRGVLSALEGRR